MSSSKKNVYDNSPQAQTFLAPRLVLWFEALRQPKWQSFALKTGGLKLVKSRVFDHVRFYSVIVEGPSRKGRRRQVRTAGPGGAGTAHTVNTRHSSSFQRQTDCPCRSIGGNCTCDREISKPYLSISNRKYVAEASPVSGKQLFLCRHFLACV